MTDFNIESLKSYLDNLRIDGETPETIEPPFDNTPKYFLKNAESDYNGKEPNLINSLSNINRAIHCQIDFLLYGLGWSEGKIKKMHFPQKIEVLNKIGIISPRILKKINKQRNLLEHEYKNPKKDEVEDALDIALLFIHYSDRYLINALTEFTLYIKDILRFRVTLDYKNNRLIFIDFEYPNGVFTEVVKKEITPNSEEYVDYLRWFLSLYKIAP